MCLPWKDVLWLIHTCLRGCQIFFQLFDHLLCHEVCGWTLFLEQFHSFWLIVLMKSNQRVFLFLFRLRNQTTMFFVFSNSEEFKNVVVWLLSEAKPNTFVGLNALSNSDFIQVMESNHHDLCFFRQGRVQTLVVLIPFAIAIKAKYQRRSELFPKWRFIHVTESNHHVFGSLTT